MLGSGGDEVSGVRVDVVEVGVVVVVVVGVVHPHLLHAGEDALHRRHVRLRGRPCPPSPSLRSAPPPPVAPAPRPVCPRGPTTPLPLP